MTFDLEAARAGIAHYRIENPSNVDTESALKELVDQANLAEDAIAEIERLRAENLELQGEVFGPDGIRANQACVIADQAARISDLEIEIAELKSDLEQSEICIQARLEVIDQQAAQIKSLKKEIRRLKHESKVEQEFTNSYIKRLHDAEARIKELEAQCEDLMQNCNSLRERAWKAEAETLTKKNAELINSYLTRIAELEDALVEGLTNFLHYRASCYDPARRCPYAKECDDCSTWDACGHVEKFRSEASRQLKEEGKIGLDDAKPRSWQVTEERVGLLEYCLETLLDAPDIEEIPGPGHSIEVLRAMLTEAGQ